MGLERPDMFDVASGECELVDFLLTRFNPLDLKTKITVDPRCRVDEQIAPKPVDPDFPEAQSEADSTPAVETPVVAPISAQAPNPTPVQEAEAVVSPSIASSDAPEEPSPPSPCAVPSPAEPLPAAPKIELKLSLPIPPAVTPVPPEAMNAPEPASLPSTPTPPEAQPSVAAEPQEAQPVALSEPGVSKPTQPKPVEAKSDAPPSASDLLALIQGFHAAAQRYNSETAWEPPVISPDHGSDHEE